MTREWTPTGTIFEASFRDNGQRLRVPPTAEIAAALRNGEATYDEITKAFNLKPNSLRRLLNLAGWSQDGEPMQTPRPTRVDRIVSFDESGDVSWMDDATCAQTDPEDFFPSHGRHTNAFATCAECPVRAKCLDAALREEAGLPLQYVHGIRGGMTPQQRVKMQEGAA